MGGRGDWERERIEKSKREEGEMKVYLCICRGRSCNLVLGIWLFPDSDTHLLTSQYHL